MEGGTMWTQSQTAGLVPKETERLNVTVLFTNDTRTRAALKVAARLAGNLDAAIQMMVVRTVPFPLELNQPPVPIAFARRQARRLAKTAGVDTNVQVYDCRDAEETILKMLPQHSIVVIGARSKWLPKQRRLIRLLSRNGHEPVLVAAKE
jgi:hypothetical protein